MYLLLGSPSSEHVAALFSSEHGLVSHLSWNVPKGAQTDLVERVGVLLDTERVDAAELQGLVVLTGPGSFSFSRTGVVAANTFRFAQGVSAVGLDCLQWGVLLARVRGVAASARVVSALSTMHDSWFIGEGVVGSVGLPELVYERISASELEKRASGAVLVADHHQSASYTFSATSMEELELLIPQLIQLPFSNEDIEPRYIVDPNIGSLQPKG